MRDEGRRGSGGGLTYLGVCRPSSGRQPRRTRQAPTVLSQAQSQAQSGAKLPTATYKCALQLRTAGVLCCSSNLAFETAPVYRGVETVSTRFWTLPRASSSTCSDVLTAPAESALNGNAHKHRRNRGSNRRAVLYLLPRRSRTLVCKLVDALLLVLPPPLS
jgi:hypothetical protein